MFLKCQNFTKATKDNTATTWSCSKTYWLMKKWTFLKSCSESNTKFWLPWSIQESCTTIICINFWPVLKKTFWQFSTSMNCMKDFNTPNTLPEEDKRCCFGKFSFGRRNPADKKAVYPSFTKSNNFWKRKLKKMSFKRKNFNQDSKSMRVKNSSTCTLNSITMTNKTLLSKISQKYVLKKLLKWPKNKMFQVELWTLDVLWEEPPSNLQAISMRLLESTYHTRS